MYAMGVDGCKAGWLCAARRSDGRVGFGVFSRTLDLFDQRSLPDVLAIDIPIGLPERGARDCDLAARRMLGRRASSVFPAPLRSLLTACSWEEACGLREKVEGKRISKQVWFILPKIREVDALVRGRRLVPRVREVHPEVCFAAWAGKPMSHSKRSAAGREERLGLVRSYFGKDDFELARAAFRAKAVADDDILDALAALRSAERILAGSARTLPRVVPCDATELPMEIVF